MIRYVIQDAETQQFAQLLALSWLCKQSAGKVDSQPHCEAWITLLRATSQFEGTGLQQKSFTNKMQRVYVQNKDGEPLMPTERCDCGPDKCWNLINCVSNPPTTNECYDDLQNMQCDPPGSACMPNPSAWICQCAGNTYSNGRCNGVDAWRWLCNELGDNKYTSC